MSDKKLPCDECNSTYLDANKKRRCKLYKHQTAEYCAQESCVDNGHYYPKIKDSVPNRTPKFDIFE